jgi:hypothetical protein
MDRWHPRRAGSIEIREIDEPGLQLFTGDSHLAFHTVIIAGGTLVPGVPCSARPYAYPAGCCYSSRSPGPTFM